MAKNDGKVVDVASRRAVYRRLRDAAPTSPRPLLCLRVKHLPAGAGGQAKRVAERASERVPFPCGKNRPDTVMNRGFGAARVASIHAHDEPTLPPDRPTSGRVGVEWRGGPLRVRSPDTSRTRARASFSPSLLSSPAFVRHPHPIQTFRL